MQHPKGLVYILKSTPSIPFFFYLSLFPTLPFVAKKDYRQYLAQQQRLRMPDA
jgi:hypothetical protein